MANDNEGGSAAGSAAALQKIALDASKLRSDD